MFVTVFALYKRVSNCLYVVSIALIPNYTKLPEESKTTDQYPWLTNTQKPQQNISKLNPAMFMFP